MVPVYKEIKKFLELYSSIDEVRQISERALTTWQLSSQSCPSVLMFRITIRSPHKNFKLIGALFVTKDQIASIQLPGGQTATKWFLIKFLGIVRWWIFEQSKFPTAITLFLLVRRGWNFACKEVYICFPCVQNFSPFGPIERELWPLEILIVQKSINTQFLKT